MKLINRILLLLAIPACITACGGDDEGGSETPEVATLQSSVPASGATDVATTTKTIELTFSKEVNFASGKSADFDGTSCGMLTFSKSKNVVTFTIPTALKRDKSYTLSVPTGFFTDANSNAEVAGFSVTFSTPETTKADKSNISKSLVTENPLPAAQKIYDYLLENYGSKTLSASMANVNWNFKEAELVYSATGKYPAIATMDYIHMYTQRSDWNSSWKVKYDDITEVQKWVASNGIVAASWHWMVPTTSGTVPTSDGTLVTDLTTSFKPSNLLIDDTWEKSIRDTEYEIMANNILKLQEAGIALIWRPFHEASGNTLSGGTAWFWWGREGAEVYKKVWIDMFNYFKEKGIRNLIWVWTTQTGYGWEESKGVMSDEDWYPGDEYVDIVGRDEYTYTVEKSLAEFNGITSTFPNKMVALSECGSVGKLSEQFAAGAKWSWAMPWYQYNATTLDNHEHANTEWWKDAMNCENVITRDQLPSWE